MVTRLERIYKANWKGFQLLLGLLFQLEVQREVQLKVLFIKHIWKTLLITHLTSFLFCPSWFPPHNHHKISSLGRWRQPPPLRARARRQRRRHQIYPFCRARASWMLLWRTITQAARRCRVKERKSPLPLRRRDRFGKYSSVVLNGCPFCVNLYNSMYVFLYYF